MKDLEDEAGDRFPEQFSAETREALVAAVDQLVAAVRAHAEHVIGLRGGSSEMTGVHEINEQVEQAIAAWNERVFDHTGTFPVSLAGLDADPENSDADADADPDADADADADEEELFDGAPLAVLSRWDLVVTDADALLAAARQAHRRTRPEEQDEDAAVAVASVAQALYTLLHDRGEPWYDLPGVEVVRGIRAYVQPEEPAGPFTDDDEETEAPVEEPAGQRLYLESWA